MKYLSETTDYLRVNSHIQNKEFIALLLLEKVKNFWEIVKTLFSDKSKSRRTITLVEDVKTESNPKKIADIFNNYFANIVNVSRV